MRVLIMTMLLMGLVLGVSYAQSSPLKSKKIKWVASGMKDLVTGDYRSVTMFFMTDGQANQLVWDQKNGTITYSLNITSITTTWTNLDVDGTAKFSISWNGQPGTLIVTRKSGQLSMQIDVNPNGDDRFYFQFNISGYQLV